MQQVKNLWAESCLLMSRMWRKISVSIPIAITHLFPPPSTVYSSQVTQDLGDRGGVQLGVMRCSCDLPSAHVGSSPCPQTNPNTVSFPCRGVPPP